MTESFRWGLLSTARINSSVLTAARTSSVCDVVAIASRSAAKANAYALAHSIDAAYASYEAMLDDPAIDAVYISLPNDLHAEWSVKSLEAGKHVLCEKPFSSEPDLVAEAFDLAREKGLVLSEGFMFRHHPQTRHVEKLVRAGAIGPLRVLRAAFAFRVPGADSDIRTSAEREGGALLDLGAYCVNVARALAGEPTRVYGHSQDYDNGVDRDFAGTMHFAGGVIAQFDVSIDQPVREHLEIVGRDGRLELDDPWHCRDPRITIVREHAVEEVAVEAVDPYRLELENVSRAAQGSEPLLLGGEDAIGQAVALRALRDSARQGTPIEVRHE
jgi:D-xylose 1-dehydrogenase (NADP+, D-xylono-1,5-lactone-forming)